MAEPRESMVSARDRLTLDAFRELARLRAALQKIADHEGDINDAGWRFYNIACNALDEQLSGDGNDTAKG